MARNMQPVLKRARALGIDSGYVGIYKKSKRLPSQSRKKKSNYAIQLTEKQKAKFIYGVLEKQFRNTFDKAKKRPGPAGENLLIMLEQRFDSVVYRMGFAATRREARQLVSHGHFTVNGKKANIPSMLLNEGDVVAVKQKSHKSPKFAEIKEMQITVPAWISIDVAKLEGTILALPTRDQIDTPVAEHLIVELYSK